MLLLLAAASVALDQPAQGSSSLRAGAATAQTWATVTILSGESIHFGTTTSQGQIPQGQPRPQPATVVVDGSAVPASLIEFP